MQLAWPDWNGTIIGFSLQVLGQLFDTGPFCGLLGVKLHLPHVMLSAYFGLLQSSHRLGRRFEAIL